MRSAIGLLHMIRRGMFKVRILVGLAGSFVSDCTGGNMAGLRAEVLLFMDSVC